jgi:hypothetical protein
MKHSLRSCRATSLSAAVLAAVLLFATVAPALAAKPVKGATYNGTVKQGSIPLLFKVSKSGKKVTKIKMSTLPLFCQGGGGPSVIKFNTARIKRKGTFSTTGTESTGGTVFAQARISGKFTAHGGAKGSLKVTYLKASSCSGKTTYTAAAAG